MGVARALLNAVFQQLVEIPRERRVEQCENGVCQCNRGKSERGRERTSKRKGFMIWIVWQGDNGR